MHFLRRLYSPSPFGRPSARGFGAPIEATDYEITPLFVKESAVGLDSSSLESTCLIFLRVITSAGYELLGVYISPLAAGMAVTYWISDLLACTAGT